jgi:putative membrane-bound dehydrogenase-like protein
MRFLSLFALALLTPMSGDDFPNPYDSEPGTAKAMPAEQAAASFRVPKGFKVSVFASEPEVRNPISMAWDPRGRLWIAENYTYAEPSKKFDVKLRDRVLIFEDADNDGKPEKRTVFFDDVQRLTSVEVGHGGVWLMAPPQLLLIPDRNNDDKPDGPAEVVLDGFDIPPENHHNFANGLHWGPDGWLYGRCGASAPGNVGAPGTPNDQRIPLAGGLWRYHPKWKTFEALSHGTTNPWGHDWNALGEAFFINTVCGHLWHSVPGMHFVRSHTIDPNPHVYELIDQHADHYHWDKSKDWTDSRKPTAEHSNAGGGHAHSGMVIHSGRNWPEEYRGKLFTVNYHGRRLNQDRLDREGSGYVGKHEPDVFFAADPFFRGVELGEGYDGSVYVLDWSDTGECHENTGVVRSSGRIYKITYGDPPKFVKRNPRDMHADMIPGVAQGNEDTLPLVLNTGPGNDWSSRQLRVREATLLASGRSTEANLKPLVKIMLDQLSSERDAKPERALSLLWMLHAMGATNETPLRNLLKHKQEAVRSWAIRLLMDRSPIDMVNGKRPFGPDPGLSPEILDLFVNMAKSDPSGLVRLWLASTLQRLPVSQRLALATPLVAHAEDANDHNLPLLIWYGLIPVADSDPSGLAQLGENCKLPTTRKLIARRLAEDLSKNPKPIGLLIGRAGKAEDSYRADILQGMTEGVKGWRKATAPKEWADASEVFAKSSTASVRDRSRELSVLFGDGRALDEVQAIALDGKADLEARRAALSSLIEARPDNLRATCEKLLGVRFLNTTAVKGLSLFDDPNIGKSLAANYRAFHPSERNAVLDTLVSRKSFAGAMLEAVTKGMIPKNEITAFHARQVRSMNDVDLSKKLAEVWGEMRDSPAEKAKEIASWKGKLAPAALASADKSKGRAVFNKLCATCHNLYGQGGLIGPDLTGSGRDNLDYVLENMIDPSATVTADYRMVVAAMKDGRILNGIIKAQTDKTLTLQTQTEALTLDRAEIEAIKASPQSLMPEGQLTTLSENEVRDLVAYLTSRSQVPLPTGGK